jgi:hypothetical protein
MPLMLAVKDTRPGPVGSELARLVHRDVHQKSRLLRFYETYYSQYKNFVGGLLMVGGRAFKDEAISSWRFYEKSIFV